MNDNGVALSFWYKVCVAVDGWTVMAGAIFTVAEPVATLISLDPVVLITIFFESGVKQNKNFIFLKFSKSSIYS